MPRSGVLSRISDRLARLGAVIDVVDRMQAWYRLHSQRKRTEKILETRKFFTENFLRRTDCRDMTSLTTEDFPYTIGYVMELLGLEERELMTFVQVLGLSPRKDEKTGRTIFTHRDIEQLKKANEMKRHGEELETIARQLGGKVSTDKPSLPQTGNAQTPASKAWSAESSGSTALSHSGSGAPVSAASSALRSSAIGKDNITVMVEAVSQVKEGILKDLGRLLDDKLAGLDEVVVELIRCKSENDSLKKKLDEAVRSKESLEYELSRFKPVQFGFYRKT
jgi:DNA-binding transcriptional MerR regulator